MSFSLILGPISLRPWTESSLFYLFWLASKLVGCTCLCVLKAGVTGMCNHIHLFKWKVGFKLMSWCLQSKMLLPTEPSFQPPPHFCSSLKLSWGEGKSNFPVFVFKQQWAQPSAAWTEFSPHGSTTQLPGEEVTRRLYSLLFVASLLSRSSLHTINKLVAYAPLSHTWIILNSDLIWP